MPAERPGAYLAACTMYRDDAAYLPEWVEFHLLMGVERFFLYDNGSTDEHREVLAPYMGAGIVTVHEWRQPFLRQRGRPRGIVTAFEHCVGEHSGDARWIAFLDIDEFVFSPAGATLPEVLRDYEQFPGVVVNRAEFGPSGHRTKPEGLVIESYLQRRDVKPDEETSIKSIVDPRRVARCLGSHSFVYRDGLPVDEEMRPLDMLRYRRHKPVCWSRMRVHHYWSRSEEERLRKARMWREAGSSRELPAAPVPAGRHPVTDESLARYAPAVREALARRGFAV
jgi:glycosyl transferase family 92